MELYNYSYIALVHCSECILTCVGALARYTRKVKRLFQTIDDSGDGAINFQEFSKLVQSPKLKFWMSQLDTRLIVKAFFTKVI